MPYAPKKKCAYPGCGVKVEKGEYYCDKHKIKRPSAAKRYGNEGYGRKWRKYRAIYLNTHPLCEECLKLGRTKEATVVDHIIPVSRGGSFWDSDNHQALCKQCHDMKTRIEVRK